MQKELRARVHAPCTAAHRALAQLKRCAKRHRHEKYTKTFLLYPPVVRHVPLFIKIEGRHEPARRLAHDARERLARAHA